VGSQLDMFGGIASSRRGAVGLAPLPESIHEVAKQLPAHLRMGTSSWTFPGWAGLVWDRPAGERTLANVGLATYARHPLLRMVGLDRTYYGPMTAEELASLVRELPADFRFLVKAHAECTTVQFAERSWYRSRAGQRNELFLEPEYATTMVVEPFMQGLGSHGGVLLFQFPAQHVSGGARSFACRLERFLAALPKGPNYAVEIRNPELLTPRYVKALESVGASHCVLEHPGMPDVHRQWQVTGGADRPALVMRWMLARPHNYGSGREAYAPFNRLIDENPNVRRAYAEMILATSKPAYLIVNNKAEGCSPLSIVRLAEQLAMLGGGNSS
jgi:uncharacterized protein YecE (DUF72 family)